MSAPLFDTARNPVLLIIDIQNAIDADYHAAAGPRNNIDAEQNIASLLAHWRARSAVVIHIRHDSLDAGSAYLPGQSGNDFKSEAAPLANERIIAKQTNSAFIGTDLEPALRALACDALFVTGVATNNSVEATVRMAGNLGFNTYLIADACFTFARRDYDDRLRSAAEVHAMSLANLDGEYCRVITLREAI